MLGEGSYLTALRPGAKGPLETIYAGMPGGGEDLVLQHSEQSEFPDARLDAHSDWFVRARFSAAGRSMTVSYGHGSPYVYAVYEGGSAQVTFARDAEVWAGPETGTGSDQDDRCLSPFSAGGSDQADRRLFPLSTLGVTVAPGGSGGVISIVKDLESVAPTLPSRSVA